jgi:hypothetical protein
MEGRMGKTKALIKKAYNEHFDYLREIGDEVDQLNAIAQTITEAALKKAIELRIGALRQELSKYAKNLETRGVEIFQNVA